ncbi:MAG TPA: EAL domain-containing protein, partial [Nitrospiria bacterium]|nr:EAL domain-containing protein [Nitrospiria bacterium]
ALDDIGAGDSNFKMILDLRPDYYKVDRYFVAGASRDPYRLAILASIADLSRKLGGVVIAEGVEHVDDLEACRASGINLVQGYLLSPPLTGKGLLRLIENRNEAFLRDEISG